FPGAKYSHTYHLKALTRTDGEGNLEILTTPPSDELKYTLEENGRIAIRPSGTEPKIKFYNGVKGNSSEDAAEKQAANEAIIQN
ncbi:phospho-sugar mutase, partial [Enterococcus faecium]